MTQPTTSTVPAETARFARDAAAAPRGARRYLVTLFATPGEWEDRLAAGTLDTVFDMNELNAELAIITARRKERAAVKHAVWQFERCPSTDRVHAHIALALSAPLLFTQLQQTEQLGRFKDNGNKYKVAFSYEPTATGWDGTEENKSACNYATKTETRVAGPFTFGTLAGVGQGKRTDLSAVVDTLREAREQGLSARDALKRAADEHPEQFIKHARGLQDYVEAANTTKPWPQLEEVICLVGQPGSGKSTYARHVFPGAYTRAYPKNNQIYYCGYDNQETLAYEEFVGGMQLQQFKKLADPGAPNLDGGEPRFTLPRSASSIMGGGGVAFGSKRLVFITNTLPLRWWDLDKLGEDSYVVERRFTKVIWFGGSYKHPEKFGTPWAREFSGADLDTFWEFCKAAPITTKLLFKEAKTKFYTDTVEFKIKSQLLCNPKKASALEKRMSA